MENWGIRQHLKFSKLPLRRTIKPIFDKNRSRGRLPVRPRVLQNLFKKAAQELLKVISQYFTGFIFANIQDFKNFAGFLHYPNTKALDEFAWRLTLRKWAPKTFFAVINSTTNESYEEIFPGNNFSKIGQNSWNLGKLIPLKFMLIKSIIFQSNIASDKSFWQMISERQMVLKKKKSTIEKFRGKILTCKLRSSH